VRTCVADRADGIARDTGPSASFSPRGGQESGPFGSSLAAGPVCRATHRTAAPQPDPRRVGLRRGCAWGRRGGWRERTAPMLTTFPVQPLAVPMTPSLHQTGERRILCNRFGNTTLSPNNCHQLLRIGSHKHRRMFVASCESLSKLIPAPTVATTWICLQANTEPRPVNLDLRLVLRFA